MAEKPRNDSAGKGRNHLTKIWKGLYNETRVYTKD